MEQGKPIIPLDRRLCRREFIATVVAGGAVLAGVHRAPQIADAGNPPTRARRPSPPQSGLESAIVLESPTLRVEFDRATGRFDLTDLRTTRRWSQVVGGHGQFPITDVRRGTDARSLRAQLKTPIGPMELVLAIAEPAEVLVSLRQSAPGRALALAFPWPFVAPSRHAELVLPVDEGVLLPAIDVDVAKVIATYGYGLFGLSMPWLGFVEAEQGLMALVETADAFRFKVDQSTAFATASVEASLLTAGVEWPPTRDGHRYERRIRFCTFERGGYVALAKRYRKFLVDSGRFRTLTEKAKELPEVNKLIGAISIHDHAKNESVLEWMIANGIRRSLYYGPRIQTRNERALAAGYVTARYDNYGQIATPELLKVWGPAESPHEQLKIGYPDEAIVRQDGSLAPGFPYPVGIEGGVLQTGQQLKTVRAVRRCSAMQLPWIQKNVPEQVDQLALKARFLDEGTAQPLTECYSTQHPLTRTEDRQARLQLFDYLRSIGQVTGSEGGADWAMPALHYQEGSLSLNYFSFPKGIYVGTAPFDLPQEYIATQFNMARRVPLLALVYHDSVLATWRWNHTPNRWVRGAEHWDDWDLIHLLYGGMPIFVVNERSIVEKGERMLQTYRNVGGVLEKIGGSEMVSHRFLTPDRQVQETRFGNGWGVIANFHQERPYIGEGGPVAPKSFMTSRWQ
ncbi:MAG: glycoside hydrolase [Candidatus Entotheonellia bacterium]